MKGAEYAKDFFGFQTLKAEKRAYEVSFGNHVEARDRTAIITTVSGLVKLLHPGGDVARSEMEEYVRFAVEMRRRVKEQLKWISAKTICCAELVFLKVRSGF